MNQHIKSYYLTYNGRVATPNFPNDEGVAAKVVALRDAFAALGVTMDVHADLVMDDQSSEE